MSDLPSKQVESMNFNITHSSDETLMAVAKLTHLFSQDYLCATTRVHRLKVRRHLQYTPNCPRFSAFGHKQGSTVPTQS